MARHDQRDQHRHEPWLRPEDPTMMGGGYGGAQDRGGQGYSNEPDGEIQGASYGRAWREADAMPTRRGPHAGRGPRGYTRSDERISEDVSDALTDDEWLDASDIDVRVEGCEVTLAGTVENRMMKRRAEDIAASVRGVIDVHNRLRIAAERAG